MNQCFVDSDSLINEINKNGCYKLIINTDEENNEINKDSNYHVVFLKNRFLSNPRFKKKLIDYYNPAGFFIKGPTENSDIEWEIEITKKLLMR